MPRSEPTYLIRIAQGALVGQSDGTVDAFKGIPYAKPPVGLLRWCAPQPPDPWQDLRMATDYGRICAQKEKVDNGIGPGPGSEDCLTLNIFRPGDGPTKLPVMVWIHGGGFTQGSSSAALYDGSALARQQVMVVTINYRLGWFGFFAHRALLEAGSATTLANFGLRDQIAALEWVRDNIAAFGGDPENVTIFGESAGGSSVNSLMVSPLARGLFHKAISQSPLGRFEAGTFDNAMYLGAAFAEGLGAINADADALRALSLERIVAAEDLSLPAGAAPIVDGIVLPQTVPAGFAAGVQARVPYLIGSTDLEISPLYAPPGLQDRVKLSEAQRSALQRLYGSESEFKAHILSDLLFTEPAHYLASQHSRVAPTYRYRFSIMPDTMRSVFAGAPHASEVPYVFMNTKVGAAWPLTDRDAELAQAIAAHWVAFAKSGNPDVEGAPVWPEADSGQIMEFTNTGAAAHADEWSDRMTAIGDAYGDADAPLRWQRRHSQ